MERFSTYYDIKYQNMGNRNPGSRLCRRWKASGNDKTQEMAITKLKQAGRTEDLPEYEKHLLSYKAGKPWCDK